MKKIMNKKTLSIIVRIALCTLSLLGFVLSAWQSVSSVSQEDLLNGITANGIGMTAPFLRQTSIYYRTGINNNKLPYTYINLPNTQDSPLGLAYLDSVKQNDAEQDEQGEQDIPPQNEPPVIPEGELPVVSLDMSENQSPDNLIYKNQSNYSPDINKLSQSEYPLNYSSPAITGKPSEPLVLIIHTHGTECYLPEEKISYSDTTPTRSSDISQNVVAVGKVLADTLNAKGIHTLHCETMFDEQSYSSAYTNSERAVVEYLKKYPSIQYVFDVHRDSIVNDKGEKIKPVTEIDGISYAQTMFVVGTDSSGANHPDWKKNLTVASIFQYALVENHPSLMRPINLRAASFNAEHTIGSLLIEIGTCGNYLSEAKNTAVALGNTIAEVILSDGI
ncbi:MAG: stage II sporulation protein P [Clostridia bacterium]|nr:stage II sporulation protein P [Clostridia bacterium]